MLAGFELYAELLESTRKRHDQMTALFAEAVKTGKPVFIGIWGPTGQRLVVSVETSENSGA